MESSAALAGRRLSFSICPSPSRHSPHFLSHAFPFSPSLSLKVFTLFSPPSSLAISSPFFLPQLIFLFCSSKSSFLPPPRMFWKLLLLSVLLPLFLMPTGPSLIFPFLKKLFVLVLMLLLFFFSLLFDCNDMEWYSETMELADIDWDSLGFGLQPTDYMYFMKCQQGGTFSKGELKRFGNIELNPSAGVLNYGQVGLDYLIACLHCEHVSSFLC